MVSLDFFVNPGDEFFAPRISHPGEDAGADIRAHVANDYNREEVESFYKEHRKLLSTKCDLFIDGTKFQPDSLDDLLTKVEDSNGAVLLLPGQTKIINSGFKVVMGTTESLGHPWSTLLPVYKIVSRSGLACKHNIVVTNAPGIIDLGYQDWVKVSLTNRGSGYHLFTHGARIAQGLFELVVNQECMKITSEESIFNVTQRSEGGFGSTSVS